MNDAKRLDILRAGLEIWKESGAAAVTARAVGKRVGVTHAGVLYHFGSIDNLRNLVATHAVLIEDSVVVPQLIVSAHPSVAHMDAATRQGYLARV